ncbi:MAG: hypothetical protein EBT96_12720 [Betaproteobacteria bacterium]|jgi:hypothetical protein|nr:hypothetical protein [Betaproteobacteria bacterium]
MNLLLDTQAEHIVGGGPSININTTVTNTVGSTTISNNSMVVAKPKIIAKPSLTTQSNLAIGVIAYGGVNSSFSASQAFAQINDLTA